jgi:hypothetical protein
MEISPRRELLQKERKGDRAKTCPTIKNCVWTAKIQKLLGSRNCNINEPPLLFQHLIVGVCLTGR